MSVNVACFDLGGVLVRICTTWPEALASAGIETELVGGPSLQDCADFERYQAGIKSEVDYLESLAIHLGGLTVQEARTVHNHILVEPYPDTLQLVLDLESNGVKTGCLSNTNHLHWQEMTATDRFPAISRLQFKTASHLAKASKPDPDIYQAFERQADVYPSQILNLDDVPAYVESAKRAGWKSVVVDPNGDPAAQMRAAMVTFGLL